MNEDRFKRGQTCYLLNLNRDRVCDTVQVLEVGNEPLCDRLGVQVKRSDGRVIWCPAEDLSPLSQKKEIRAVRS